MILLRMKTVVVTLTDQGYAHKAKRTLQDVRGRGEWTGDVVLITVECDLSPNWLDFHRVTPFRVNHLDTSYLLEQYRMDPIRPTCDQRETAKLTQWDKFYVFHEFFRKWDRVIFLDAGLRVVDRIQHLLDLPCDGVLMAPDDAAPYDTEKRFGGIIELDGHPAVTAKLFQEYPPSIATERYFLNCIWMYDTALLSTITMQELVAAMNKYPICRCNEMTIMNLIFTFKYRVWRPFPGHCVKDPQRRLFGWTEHDRDYGPYTTWRDFCFLKYPSSLSFDCE